MIENHTPINENSTLLLAFGCAIFRVVSVAIANLGSVICQTFSRVALMIHAANALQTLGAEVGRKIVEKGFIEKSKA